ncbi:MAG: hypothetical protein ACQESP_12560 [Candidatus Muiribacteriota bacterium]
MKKNRGYFNYIILFLLTLLLSVFFITNQHIRTNRLQGEKLSDETLNNLKIESAVHQVYAELKNSSINDIYNQVIKKNYYEKTFDNVEVILTHANINPYKQFVSDGNFFSDERKALFHIKGTLNNKTLNLAVSYDFYRYTPPFSGNYVFYLKNPPEPHLINHILNNSAGNPINNYFPMQILSEGGRIHFGSDKKIVLNTAHGSGKYGESFKLFSPEINSNILSVYKGAYSQLRNDPAFNSSLFENKEHYSSFFRLSGTNKQNYKPEVTGNIMKAQFQINAYTPSESTVKEPVLLEYNNPPENIPDFIKTEYEKFHSNRIITKYNNNTTQNYELNIKNFFDRGRMRDIRKLNENTFFNLRINKRVSNLDKFHSVQNNISTLDLKKNVVFLDKNVTYIPYIEKVKSGGTIISNGDIYIDTIINGQNKPLTIVSLSGKILIANEVHASLHTMSSRGSIEGIHNNPKKIYGNIITSSINMRSFRQGLTLKYHPLYSEPHYNMKVSETASSILPDKLI